MAEFYEYPLEVQLYVASILGEEPEPYPEWDGGDMPRAGQGRRAAWRKKWNDYRHRRNERESEIRKWNRQAKQLAQTIVTGKRKGVQFEAGVEWAGFGVGVSAGGKDVPETISTVYDYSTTPADIPFEKTADKTVSDEVIEWVNAHPYEALGIGVGALLGIALFRR